MTYDTFESLKIGDKLNPTGKKRSYPVVSIGQHPNGARAVYVCLNPIAVEKRKETAKEFGIFLAPSLNNSSHYLNWERVL
jgi:hypothetical protein